MKPATYRFLLDMQSVQSQISIPVLLGDTSRTFRISLSDGGNPYIIEDGCLAVMTIKRPSGKRMEVFCNIEDNTTIVYPFAENEYTAIEEGVHNCDVTLYDTEGKTIATPRFTFVVTERVLKNDDIVITDEDITVFDAIMAKEAERQVDEKERAEAEKARVTAESGRATAEEERISAEEERISAETERISAEEERNSAESKRASKDWNRELLVNAALSATAEAKTTATQAEETANSAKSTAIRAEATANVAKQQSDTDRLTLANLSAQVNGIARSYVVPTFTEFIDFLQSRIGITLKEDRDGNGVEETYSIYVSDLKTGDNIIITEKNVPDFWFEKNSALTSFETHTYNGEEYLLSATKGMWMTVVGGAHILETDYTVIEGHATSAAASASDAKKSETNAKTSETNAKTSETNASAAADRAEAAAERAEAADSEDIAKRLSALEAQMSDYVTEVDTLIGGDS